jgi:hypothetical protein
VTEEEEAFEADVVATDGGSRNHGYHFEPNITLGSCTDKCTPHRRHGGTTLAIGQGRRVCLQHPDDETRTKDKCIPLGDGGTNVLVFSDQDACGCCGGECPSKCTACVCSDVDRDGTEFTGVWMSVPRHGHHLWGGSSSSDKCVRTEDTVDMQLRGGSCYDDAVVAAGCPVSNYNNHIKKQVPMS